MPYNQEVMGSNPARYWAIFLFLTTYFLQQRSVLKQVPRGGAPLLVLQAQSAEKLGKHLLEAEE